MTLPVGLRRILGGGWLSTGTQMEKGLKCGICLTWLACGIVFTIIWKAPGADFGKALGR